MWVYSALLIGIVLLAVGIATADLGAILFGGGVAIVFGVLAWYFRSRRRGGYPSY